MQKIIGYTAIIRFKDTPLLTQEVYIKVGSFDYDTATEEQKTQDENVFFYLDSPEEINNFLLPGVEEFTVVHYTPVFKELRFYLIAPVNQEGSATTDEEFITESERQGTVYSLESFQKAFNNEEISTDLHLLRIL